jgi:two-component system, OmpR family, sensor histidine kinase KdpD
MPRHRGLSRPRRGVPFHGVRDRRDLLVGIPAAAGAVAVVSALVSVLEPHVPVLSLGVLYVFAVLPVALFWGTGLAVAVSVASMLTFNYFFLPPRHSFHLQESQNWLALAVYLVTAVVVGVLAARARRRGDDAEQRRAEAHVLAETASELLRGSELDDVIAHLAELSAGVLRVDVARLELGTLPAEDGERALPLVVGRRTVATLFVDEDAAVDEAVARRFLPALAALLGLAADRRALEAEALEAEALRRSDALKTALLRTVSHDLRSPLTAILAAAGALGNPELQLDDADRAVLTDAIREEATRLDRVVGDLLDLSRLEAGSAEPHRELWPVDELVAQALESVGPTAERVVVEIDDDAPPVQVDAAQIERVLANLIDNALKFSPPQSPVVVRAEHGATELRIHVVDRGPGLTPSERDAVFQPFRRGADTAGNVRGAGLGLAIARGFAEANGAHLWAQDDPAGGHFVLALARAEQPAVRT